jgi:hypothetical protein
MMEKNETDILKNLADSVIEMGEKKAAAFAKEVLETEIDA